jgi:hypothetical protein
MVIQVVNGDYNHHIVKNTNFQTKRVSYNVILGGRAQEGHSPQSFLWTPAAGGAGGTFFVRFLCEMASGASAREVLASETSDFWRIFVLGVGFCEHPLGSVIHRKKR